MNKYRVNYNNLENKTFAINMAKDIVADLNSYNNDDIDLEPGFVRIRKSGSAGTHNGLKSIIRETGSGEFNRVRVGIGSKQEHQDLANFVLGKMRMTENQKQGLEKAASSVYDYILGSSVDEIMSKYNGNSNSNGKH